MPELDLDQANTSREACTRKSAGHLSSTVRQARNCTIGKPSLEEVDEGATDYLGIAGELVIQFMRKPLIIVNVETCTEENFRTKNLT